MIQRYKNLPIRTKLTSIFVIVLFLVSSFISVYFPQKQKQQVTDTLKSKVEITIRMLASGVSLAMGEGDYQFVNHLFNLTKEDTNIVYIAILDNEGNKLISFNPKEIHIPSPSGKKTFEEHGILHSSIPTLIEDDIYGHLIIGFSLEERDKEIAIIRWTGFGISLSIFILGILMSIYLGLLITKPLHTVVDTIKRIGGTGDYDYKIEKDSTDEIGELIDAFNDMSEKILTRTQELQQSESKMDAMLNTVGEGIISIDETSRIVMINQKALNIWGYKREEILGDKIQILMPEKYRTDHTSGMERYLKTSVPHMLGQRVELEGQKKDGSIFPLEISISKTELADKILFTAAIRDITVQKKMDELKMALNAARESDRLKSEFLANTSHELRTPLNSIIGFLQLILDGLCDSREEEKEFLSNALKSSNHLLNLINDVLDIAKIEAGKMDLKLEDVNLNYVFDKIFSLTHVQAQQKNISLNFFTKESKEIFVKADDQKLKQVLLNLVGNSIKFTTKGSISVSAEAISERGITKVQVIDTGIGIPSGKQIDIFDKFTQVDGSTSRNYGGAGLGLSITKNLIELMGGTIELISPGVNQGTTVEFTLTLSTINPAKKSSISSKKKMLNENSSSLLKPHIVIVGGNQVIRTYIEELLQKSGYKTSSAKTADEGLHLIQEILPKCVITESILPNGKETTLKDGLSLITALQATDSTHNIPTILLTGQKEQIKKILSINSNISLKPVILGKPINNNKLLSFLNDLGQKNQKQNLNILIADDDPNVGRFLKKILNKNNYHLSIVENGKEAINFIEEKRESIDIILLDLMMPIMNGYEVLSKLKQNRETQNIPVIIITNYPEANIMEHKRLLSKEVILELITKEELNRNPETLLKLLKTASV